MSPSIWSQVRSRNRAYARETWQVGRECQLKGLSEKNHPRSDLCSAESEIAAGTTPPGFSRKES
jgi:hypothetical protein